MLGKNLISRWVWPLLGSKPDSSKANTVIWTLQWSVMDLVKHPLFPFVWNVMTAFKDFSQSHFGLYPLQSPSLMCPSNCLGWESESLIDRLAPCLSIWWQMRNRQAQSKAYIWTIYGLCGLKSDLLLIEYWELMCRKSQSLDLMPWIL